MRLPLKLLKIYLVFLLLFNPQALYAAETDSLTLKVTVIDQPPQGTITINDLAEYTNSTSVTLTLSATDSESSVDKMQFSNDNSTWSDPEAYATTKTWTLASGEGIKTVYVRYKDVAGNWSQAFSDTIILDTVAPEIPTIDPVTSPTDISSQTLTGTKSTDTVSIIVTCPTATVGQVTYPLATTWSCQLTLGSGTNDITVKARDAAGNESGSAVTSIFYSRNNQAPQILALMPASGTSNPEQTATFYTTFTDPDGWEDIQYVYFLVNTSTNGANCFYGYYDLNANMFYLRNDANTAWLGGYGSGTTNTIENSYAKLDCFSSYVVGGTNNILWVTWSVVFKSAFRGVKNTYLFVRDNFDAYDGWLQKGDFCIYREPISPPD